MKTHLSELDFQDPLNIRKSQMDKILSCYKPIEKAEGKENKPKIDEFRHNKLMAGYHSVKSAELNDEGLKLHATDKPDLHKTADEKKSEAERHKTIATEYREKAKSLYNKDIHGEWNSTIPTKDEALKYGTTHSKKVEKETQETADIQEDVIEKEEDTEVTKAEKLALIDEIIKGGVGSGKKSN